MYLLVLVLEQLEKLPDILRNLIRIGLTGTTVLKSTGMGRLLAEWEIDVPILQLIQTVVEDKSRMNRTLFTVIEDQDILEEAIAAIKEVTGNLNEHGKGILFAFPLTYAEGIKKHFPGAGKKDDKHLIPLTDSNNN